MSLFFCWVSTLFQELAIAEGFVGSIEESEEETCESKTKADVKHTSKANLVLKYANQNAARDR